jgi:glycosyltransferase involved in cell wall biosynthesis
MSLRQFDVPHAGIRRYVMLLIATLVTFLKERPTLIVVQNPSLVLALFTVYYGKFMRTPVLVDAHNAGVYPQLFISGSNGINRWLKRLAWHLFRQARLTIVTNDGLKEYVEGHGGRTVVLPDRVPSLPPQQKRVSLKGRSNILCICSYDVDEPYMEVLAAASQINPQIFVYFTGRYKGKEDLANMAPSNVVFTGYLPEQEFVNLLWSCDVVLDLTTRRDCLVCGAYEAVAAEKPMILSDSKVNRELFSKGALYVNNTANDIARQIERAVARLEHLQKDCIELRREMDVAWDCRRRGLEHMLVGLEQE